MRPNSVLLGLPGRKAMCFQREGEQALGFAYCSLSEDAIAGASAHHGGGSLVWDGRGWQGLAGQRGALSPPQTSQLLSSQPGNWEVKQETQQGPGGSGTVLSPPLGVGGEGPC